jgi:hypothetical protein
MSEKEIMNAILEGFQKLNARLDGLEKKVDLIRDEMKTNFDRLEEEVHFALKKTLENRETIRALTNIKK